MSAILAMLSGGWGKVAAYGAAAVSMLAAVGAVLGMARRDGIQAQQAADNKQQEASRAKADIAASRVAALDDDAVVDELHRDFNRKP